MDTQPPQHAAKDRAAENRLVVGTDDLGLAVLLDCAQQCSQDRDRSLVFEGLQVQAPTGAVIDHAEQEMPPPLFVGFPGAVHVPDKVGLAGSVAPASPFSALLLDVVLMGPDEIADESLADGMVIGAEVTAVEEVGDLAAPDIAETSRVAQDFLPDPVRLSAQVCGKDFARLARRAPKAMTQVVSGTAPDYPVQPSEAGACKRTHGSEDRVVQETPAA